MRIISLIAVLVLAFGCRRAAEPSVVGRWQHTAQPKEWLEFRRDGSFRARSFTGTEIFDGTWRQDGDSVTVTVPNGHGGTLTVSDTLLVMHDAIRTKYRRIRR